MSDEYQHRELQLSLHTPSTLTQPPGLPNKPSLDLSLSMTVGSPQLPENNKAESNRRNVRALKQHAAEQTRLAAAERAYAERVRELTRRELELADKEFVRARIIWERAREEMEKVERMKVAASRRIGNNCIEIRCQACMQRFEP